MKTWVVLLSCGLSSIAAAATAPDAGLFTAYVPSTGFTNMAFFVCGSVPGSEGCYGSGSLGPFGRVGAMIEGGARVSGSAVTHNVYVVDVAAGASKTDVLLYRYLFTNTVQPPYATITYKLSKKIPLPLTGGIKAHASLAANAGFLFVGTDQSTSVVRVTKNGYALTSFGGFSNNPTVSAITSDPHGFVMVAFGGNTDGGNIEFGPDGNIFGDGGGIWFTLPSTQGILTTDLPSN